MSLIDSVGRSASAVTLENSLLLWMDKANFHYILDNFTPVARNLVKILWPAFSLSDQMIQALATLDVNGRVARQLLAFAEKYGYEKDVQPRSALCSPKAISPTWWALRASA